MAYSKKTVNSGVVKQNNTPKNNLTPKNNKEKDSVQRWVEWSMTPHTPEEIREKILTNPDEVCFTFLCRYSKMPVEFIEELFVLSSLWLNKSNYELHYEDIKKFMFAKYEVGENNDNIDVVTIKCTEEKWDKLKNKYSSYDKIPLITKILQKTDVNEKIDWLYITTYQSLTKEFVLKFEKYVRWNLMEPQNDITADLIAEYRKKYSSAGVKSKEEEELLNAKDLEDEDDIESDFDEEYDFDDLD